jgi:hypothetical protein
MIRQFYSAAMLLCYAGLFAVPPLHAEQIMAAGPICLYQGKSYSEGALVCVQKSLMLNCAAEGTQATWKPVVDPELSQRCVTPAALAHPPALHRRHHRMYASRHIIEPARQMAAKCFSFNGKQYCE